LGLRARVKGKGLGLGIWVRVRVRVRVRVKVRVRVCTALINGLDNELMCCCKTPSIWPWGEGFAG
jgi:hypothetical protein